MTADTSDAALIAWAQRTIISLKALIATAPELDRVMEWNANIVMLRALTARLRDGWRAMDDAPKGVPIVVKMGWWVATVEIDPVDPSEAHHVNGDTIMHHNGRPLMTRFHGVYDGWQPTPLPAPPLEA